MLWHFYDPFSFFIFIAIDKNELLTIAQKKRYIKKFKEQIGNIK